MLSGDGLREWMDRVNADTREVSGNLQQAAAVCFAAGTHTRIPLAPIHVPSDVCPLHVHPGEVGRAMETGQPSPSPAQR